MKKRRLPFHELAEIEKALLSLPHPLRVEREGKGPVRVFDEISALLQALSLLSAKCLPPLALSSLPTQTSLPQPLSISP